MIGVSHVASSLNDSHGLTTREGPRHSMDHDHEEPSTHEDRKTSTSSDA